jgi:hypothetical protein
MALYYAYQAVDSVTLGVYGWQAPVPDPTGALYPGPNDPTAIVRLNDPTEDSADNLLAWSGVGITGSQTPTSIVLGEGLSGAFASGAITLTTTPVLKVMNGETASVYSNVRRLIFTGATVVPSGTDDVIITTATAAIHNPVHGVTTANLAATAGGLVYPSNSVEVTEYDGIETYTIYFYSDYDAVAADIVTNVSRILVAAQTDPAENGIYYWDGAKLIRGTDTFSVGHLIPVSTGRTWRGASWVATGANTFEPSAGNETHTAWVSMSPQNGVSEADRWEHLLDIEGPSGASADDYILDIELTATISGETDGERYVATARAAYLGSVGGDMVPMGDDLNSQFGVPWESPSDVRIRAVIDGSTLTLEGLAGEYPGQSWRFGISAKATVRQVV